jgi:CDP-diacylglycerol--serine O-phosphatidyltransferase
MAGSDVRWLACGLTVFAGVTMVSNIRFYSFKDINPEEERAFRDCSDRPWFCVGGL